MLHDPWSKPLLYTVFTVLCLLYCDYCTVFTCLCLRYCVNCTGLSILCLLYCVCSSLFLQPKNIIISERTFRNLFIFIIIKTIYRGRYRKTFYAIIHSVSWKARAFVGVSRLHPSVILIYTNKQNNIKLQKLL